MSATTRQSEISEYRVIEDDPQAAAINVGTSAPSYNIQNPDGSTNVLDGSAPSRQRIVETAAQKLKKLKRVRKYVQSELRKRRKKVLLAARVPKRRIKDRIEKESRRKNRKKR